MTVEKTLTISVVRRFPHAIERVFDAWLDPALAARFLFATADGEMRVVDIDARVDGSYRIIERRGEEDAEHLGEYLEIERPTRLVFTFGIDRNDPTRDRITLAFTPLAEGCELRLEHEVRAAWAHYATATRDGWNMILGHLARALDSA